MDANLLQRFLTHRTHQKCSFHKLEGMSHFQHKGSGASGTVPAQASSPAPIFNFSKDNYAQDIPAGSSADEVEEFSESLGSSNSETETESESNSRSSWRSFSKK